MILLTLIISLFSIAADAIIKKAADEKNTLYLLGGIVLYGISAFVWYQVYKSAKFSTVAVVYSLFTIFLSVFIGVLFFQEKITQNEVIGLALGLISIFLLT